MACVLEESLTCRFGSRCPALGGLPACVVSVACVCPTQGTERVDGLIFGLLARLTGAGFSLEKGHLLNVG